jgi:gliding motility-associated-like protein
MKPSRVQKTLLTTLLLLASFATFAQDFSNKGKEFWITFPVHVDGTGAVMGIYITSDRAASGTVRAGANTIPFSIPANGVRRVFLGTGGDAPNTSVYQSQIEGIFTNSAIHVTSDVPIVVYAHIIRTARSGASLILPTAVWGKEYLVPSFRSQGQSGANSGFGTVTVVAKEPNTVIEITPAVSTRANQPAGIPYTVTLSQPGDVYQVQFPKDADISGTLVKSIAAGGSGCKPIGVFSSTSWSAFDCFNASGGDNLYQQLFPTRSFGRSFLTAPFSRKQYDIIRVFVLDPTTQVTRTENGLTTTLGGLNPAGYYEFITQFPNKIDADKPISVVQYMTSQTCGPTGPNTVQSDPEMIILNPVEQTINNITVFSAHRNWVPPGQSNVDRCYLNIIIQTIAAPSFRINGLPPAGGFQVIPGTNYSYLQEEVTNLSLVNPIQTLTADSSFSAIAYGYGNVESYGYNAGTNVIDRSQFITIKNEFATVNFPATCINSPFNFAITLPYQTPQLRWLFYGRFNDTIINNPVPDSSFVLDGRTLYQYRLPGTYILSQLGLYKVTVFAINPSSDGCAGEQQIDYDVQVFDKPTANFSRLHTGCVTDSVRFTDLSNGRGRNISFWKWDFGDNTRDSVRNPVKKYASPGLYNVKQTIITDIGCLADTTIAIDITLPPTARFGVSAPQCVGSSITFTDSSSSVGSNLVRWYWNYGDGRRDTLTTNAPRVLSYASTGTYQVSLVVQTQSGCQSLAFSRTIGIHPFPVPNFQLPAAVCLPSGTAAFTNLSSIADGTTATLKYAWQFGDGTTDTTLNPVHRYGSLGSFSVNLRVTSAAGCTDDTTKLLSAVFAQPKAEIAGGAKVCLGDSSRFIDASTAINQTLAKYFWDFGDPLPDTTQNPARRFSTSDTFMVRHWVQSNQGCVSDTVSVQHIVHPLPVPNFVVGPVSCETQPTLFSNNSVPSVGVINRWQWNLGDGTLRDVTNGNPFSHTYATPGSKEIKLRVTNSEGCASDTLTRLIQVNVLPKPSFVLPEVCLTDASATFANNTTISDGTGASLTWLWNFGDPNASAVNPNISTVRAPSHKYSAASNYPVKLVVTSASGCKDSVEQILTVNGDRPNAAFIMVTQGNLCSNLPVTIQNKSTVNFGSVTRTEIFWNWPSTTESTTDETPSFDKTYTHQYANFQSPASKTVQIRFLAYSGGICVSESVQTITLNASPKVFFSTVPGICLDAVPRFITQASDAAGLAGQGAYSGNGIGSNGLFTPTTPGVGTHNLKYVYTSNQGCRDSASNTIVVWPRPSAAFTVDPPTCHTQPVTIRSAATPNFGQLTTWNWTLGDGNTVVRTTANAFTHAYAATGTFNLQLQVQTDSGCNSLVASSPIVVHPLPMVDFSLPVVCMPSGLASFTDNSTIADGSTGQFSHRWDFGVNGAGSTQRNPTFNYPAVGSYPVKLVVTSNNGCKDSLTKQLTDINPQPLTNFSITPAEVCVGTPMQFNDLSNSLSQTKTNWFWNFADGNTSQTANPSHTFSRAGTFSVSFYYTTNKGCHSDTLILPAVVHPFPQVNAGPDLVLLEGGQVTIAASVSGSSENRYSWSPATGLSNPTVLQPIARPSDDITYTLTVTGKGNCSAKDDVFVKVLLEPEIPTAFSPNGDGINDVWNIKFISSYPGAVIQVFDRYGKRIFNSTGYNTPWDGKVNGSLVPAGVYYFIIDPKNGRKARTGSVTVIR